GTAPGAVLGWRSRAFFAATPGVRTALIRRLIFATSATWPRGATGAGAGGRRAWRFLRSDRIPRNRGLVAKRKPVALPALAPSPQCGEGPRASGSSRGPRIAPADHLVLPARQKSGMRLRNSSTATVISMRARLEPTQ